MHACKGSASIIDGINIRLAMPGSLIIYIRRAWGELPGSLLFFWLRTTDWCRKRRQARWWWSCISMRLIWFMPFSGYHLLSERKRESQSSLCHRMASGFISIEFNQPQLLMSVTFWWEKVSQRRIITQWRVQMKLADLPFSSLLMNFWCLVFGFYVSGQKGKCSLYNIIHSTITAIVVVRIRKSITKLAEIVTRERGLELARGTKDWRSQWKLGEIKILTHR